MAKQKKSPSKSTQNKLSPYKVMTSILTNYHPTLEEKMSLNSFFMCRYLSNHPKSIFVANIINLYYNVIPLNVQYDFANQLLVGKISFIQAQKKEKLDTKLLDNISRYYNVSQQYAIEYLELMSKEQIEFFTHLYDSQ